MKDLIEYLAHGLVDQHEAIEVEERMDRGSPVYHLFVAENETGRVIGREGKVANAIRILMECSLHASDRPPILKVM